MSFGRAHIIGGAGSINEPGNPAPATFFPEESPSIVSGEWVSFTRTEDDEAINIVQAPDPANLLNLTKPEKGVTPAAERLLTRHLLELAFPDGVAQGEHVDSRLTEVSNSRLEKLRGILTSHDQRVGVAAMRDALHEIGGDDAR